MSNRIAMVDLAWRHAQDQERVEARVLDVLRSGRWLGGPVVDEAEQCMAGLFERAGAVGVASGTDALALALQAVGVRVGDRVGVPALTFFATAGAVCSIGAVPEVLDVDDRGLLASCPDDLAAVVPVHLFGNRASVRARCPVVDDAAQAVGFGRGEGVLTAVSTYPTKLLSGAGNGGFVLGDDPRLLERVRQLGSHGMSEPHLHHCIGAHVGRNSRLGALQAAVLVEQHRSLARRIERRRAIAAQYDQVVGALALPRDPENPVPLYCLRVPERARWRSVLASAGIDSAVYYPRPIHQQPALEERIEPVDLPVAERLCRELLAIPVHAGLDDADVDHVLNTLRSLVG